MRIILIAAMLVFSTLTMGKEILLTKDNTLVLNSVVRADTVSNLISQAKKIDSELKSGYPIYLFLYTPGGSVQAGLELIEYLNGLNRPVHTVTMFAASMGWQIAQHLDKRYILKYGVLMSHKAQGGFRGEFGGSSSQIDSRYTLWLRRLNMMDSQTAFRTDGKKTLKQYQSEYDNELWLNGPEAVKNGYADEVVNVKCSANLSNSEPIRIIKRGHSIIFKFDNCPLRTYPTVVRSNVRTNQGNMSLENFLDKGGIFGSYCRSEDEEVSGFRGKNSKILPAQLCLMNKDLTLEDIQRDLEIEKDAILNKKNNVIRMSFGNFVNGI